MHARYLIKENAPRLNVSAAKMFLCVETRSNPPLEITRLLHVVLVSHVNAPIVITTTYRQVVVPDGGAKQR